MLRLPIKASPAVTMPMLSCQIFLAVAAAMGPYLSNVVTDAFLHPLLLLYGPVTPLLFCQL